MRLMKASAELRTASEILAVRAAVALPWLGAGSRATGTSLAHCALHGRRRENAITSLERSQQRGARLTEGEA